MAMVGQRKITRFFCAAASSTVPKRKAFAPIQEAAVSKKSKHGDIDKVNGGQSCPHVLAENKKHLEMVLQQDKMDIGESWKIALGSDLDSPYFQKLCDFVKAERLRFTVYPPIEQVYAWTQHCEISEVKVVILGQDPYHGPNQAHGLCFSVQRGIKPPPSLVNMFSELKNDIPNFEHPGHGDLTKWAKQGVLLLNAVLTVRDSQPNSHKAHGWERFTDSVIAWINTNLRCVVFMLWGSYAQKKGLKIDRSRHLVLNAVHPSPLSAYRGFFGCKHFSQANDYLVKQDKQPIDWCLTP